MKTIIAGSRTCTDIRFVYQAIKQSDFTITEVVCGLDKGPDLMGWQYAKQQSIPVKFFPAKWREGGVYNSKAGHLRNEEMARYANALIAIWDGSSAGTKNMIKTARLLGLNVFVFRFDRAVLSPMQVSVVHPDQFRSSK